MNARKRKAQIYESLAALLEGEIDNGSEWITSDHSDGATGEPHTPSEAAARRRIVSEVAGSFSVRASKLRRAR